MSIGSSYTVKWSTRWYMIPSYIVAGAISDTIRQLPASGELEEKERIPRTSHQMDTWGGIQMDI